MNDKQFHEAVYNLWSGQDVWLNWLLQSEMAACPHKRMQTDSNNTADGGQFVEYHCPDCGRTHVEFISWEDRNDH